MSVECVRICAAVLLGAAVLAAADGGLPALEAGPRLPAIFGDHMVLQRGMPVPVWGTAAPGEKVTVRFRGRTKTAVAGADGKWMVRLDALGADADQEGSELAVQGRTRITVRDVLVGEVWICSGQSNMEMPLAKAANGRAEQAAADLPNVRLFKVRKASAREPQGDCPGSWAPCSPASAGAFSAVAYFMGRDLHETLGVPVGLIQTAWSGATAEAMLPAPALRAHERFREKFAALETFRKDYPRLMAEYGAKRAAWEKLAAKARAEGRPAPPGRPGQPKHPDGPERSLGGLYNAMVHGLIPYAIRGVAWYQGENNVINTAEYHELLPMLIRQWRRLWGEGDLPFLLVQIANFGARDGLSELHWPELREAQLAGLAEPNTAMVVAIDLGEAASLHPKNKQDVGKRLALAAKALAYGRKDLVYMGPLFDGAAFDGAEATVRFKHVGGGLVARGPDAPRLKGFVLAGSDRTFHPAEARIQAGKVVVSSDPVRRPVAVRYGWADNPDCNLYNQEGLPASPFRTDDWPRAR